MKKQSGDNKNIQAALQTQAQQARKRAESAKKLARDAKAKSKEARQEFKQAKKAARQAKDDLEAIQEKLKKLSHQTKRTTAKKTAKAKVTDAGVRRSTAEKPSVRTASKAPIPAILPKSPKRSVKKKKRVAPPQAALGTSESANAVDTPDSTANQRDEAGEA